MADWAKAAGVACFVKQLGSKPVSFLGDGWLNVKFHDHAGADPSEWPKDLRVQQFPMPRQVAA